MLEGVKEWHIENMEVGRISEGKGWVKLHVISAVISQDYTSKPRASDKGRIYVFYAYKNKMPNTH
jgi:hypothetical protein